VSGRGTGQEQDETSRLFCDACERDRHSIIRPHAADADYLTVSTYGYLSHTVPSIYPSVHPSIPIHAPCPAPALAHPSPAGPQRPLIHQGRPTRQYHKPKAQSIARANRAAYSKSAACRPRAGINASAARRREGHAIMRRRRRGGQGRGPIRGLRSWKERLGL
jgi:hypothetical protein